jgi:hypothetical protein
LLVGSREECAHNYSNFIFFYLCVVLFELETIELKSGCLLKSFYGREDDDEEKEIPPPPSQSCFVTVLFWLQHWVNPGKDYEKYLNMGSRTTEVMVLQ